MHVYSKNKSELEPEWKSHVTDIKRIIEDKSNELTSKYTKDDELKAAYGVWYREYKPQLWPLDGYKFIDKGGVYAGIRGVHNPGKEGYRYDVIHPKSGKPCKEPLMGYRFPKETMDDLIDKRKIIFGEDESKIIELKNYIFDFKEKLSSVMEIDNRSGAYDVRALFPELRTAFENPKPVKFLKSIFPFLLGEDDVFLDFFAGSGSSADTIYQLVNKDHKKRKFILVQLPEIINKKNDAYKKGYRKLSALSIERIHRAGSKIRSEIESQLDLQGNHSLDLGFKVLKLDQSNFKPWQSPGKEISDDELLKQMELAVDHIDPNASEEDLLYELLLKAGVKPTETIERIVLAGHKLFRVGEDSLYIHLEKDIDQALIDAVLAANPDEFICLDRAFHGNDQLKANAAKTFETYNQGREGLDRIEFKTV